MKIEAMPGSLIIKSLDKEEITTESGIVISNTSAEAGRTIKGEVLATGGKKLLGDKLVDMQAKVGDTVLFDTYKAAEIQLEGVTYYKIEEEKLFGVLR